MPKKTAGKSRGLRVLSVVSTRPELIKMAPVLKALARRRRSGVESVFVTTGQHYDQELFGVFVRELGLPQPDENLAVGSGSQAFQTGESVKRIERVITKYAPNVVLAEGDTNSVLAAALAAQKLSVPFGHVEAGLRSFDRTMPEEINRIAADHCAELLFAPTERSALNLLLEDVPKNKVFITGNTIVDAVKQNLPLARKRSKIRSSLPPKYYLLTLHRKENTDSPQRLKAIFSAVGRLGAPVVFPMHPRTKKFVAKYGVALKNVLVVPPLGYFDFLAAEEGAKAILTDSGGVQEEACVLGKRCVVLRENTERPEALGANCVLAGTDARRIIAESRKPASRGACPFGDGKAGERIVSILLGNDLRVESSDFVGRGYPERALLPAVAGWTVARFEKKFGGVGVLFEGGRMARYPSPGRVLKKKDLLLVTQ